ncbi:DUF6978 family protein [Methanococcus maripaludis]|uniref:Uncharacterized protein n=1 Tax=Methanococcus maripaludis TaxID=39152 RepID=A0A7J9SCE5_METMI|nr:hypothetical protein [Methanococcus maripaludis]MBB6497315.1 hypothetical protein [Methanococcus maripaludis]
MFLIIIGTKSTFLNILFLIIYLLDFKGDNITITDEYSIELLNTDKHPDKKSKDVIVISPTMDTPKHKYDLISGARLQKEKYNLYVSCKTRPVFTKNSIKLTLNLVCRGETILSRLDIGGKHRNPGEKQLPEHDTLKSILEDYPKKEFGKKEPHIHIYTLNNNDAWAIPADKLISLTGSNITDTFKNYLKYCNVKLNVNSELTSSIDNKDFYQMKL